MVRTVLAVAAWLVILAPASSHAVPAIFIEDQTVWKTPEAFERAGSTSPGERKAAIACEAKAGTRIESIGSVRGSWLWLIEIRSGPNAGCRGVVKPLAFRNASEVTAPQAPSREATGANAQPPARTQEVAAKDVAPPPPATPATLPSAQPAAPEPIDIKAEVDNLKTQLASVMDREAHCLAQASSAGSTYSSSGSNSYSSSGGTTFYRENSDRASVYRGSTGSSSYSSSSTYTSPGSNADACRIQANAARNGINASIRLAAEEPSRFVELVRAGRVRERAIVAQRTRVFEPALAGVRRDLETLASASPEDAGLEAFAKTLISLDRGVAALWRSRPSGEEFEWSLQRVQQAMDAFRLARDRWRDKEKDHSEVYKQALPFAADALAGLPSPAAAR